ncbi:tyrosine-protein kinase transmembrane receptor Ror-like [Planococcus citri]|uniref:tyrosine-protein kinase transmembrane receptor Ror-like n=1 Tax=Planococcus citri TaxID=170843 RepID=UPI0031F9927E
MTFTLYPPTPCTDNGTECNGTVDVHCGLFDDPKFPRQCQCYEVDKVYYNGSCITRSTALPETTTAEVKNQYISSPDDIPYRSIMFAVVGGAIILVLVIVIIWKLYRSYKKHREEEFLEETWAKLEAGRIDYDARVFENNPSYDPGKNAQSVGLLPEVTDHTKDNSGDSELKDFIDSCLKQIPLLEKKKLTERRLIGRGNFGDVYRAKLTITNGDEHSYETVAVKTLRRGATEKAKRDIWKEAYIVSQFTHPNILKLRYICLGENDELPEMVFEHMNLGDLHGLLRSSSGKCRPIPGLPILSQDDLLRIASQIAQGMEYLASQKYVHGDLATRNCLVGVPPASSTYVVKICDFGLSKDVYLNNCYRITEDGYMPIPWMPPESIKSLTFTLQSDVWAFGVTLWEIVTFGEQPYFKYSTERIKQLIQLRTLLKIPKKCPTKVVAIMMGCWKEDPEKRLDFSAICARFSELLENDRPIPKRVPENSNYAAP